MPEEKKCKILLVDDVEMNLVILSEIIKTMGHQPLMAQSVKDAIAILEAEIPQLILLDVSMPDMNGLEFCELLKKDVYTRDIPIIFISALDSTEDHSKAFEVGAVDYISKPFDPADVCMRVTTHLKLAMVQYELENANRRLNMVIKNQMTAGRTREKELFRVVAELGNERDAKRTYSRLSEPKMVHILAQAMQFSEAYEEQITDAYLEDIELAAIIHDIGTIKLPDSVVIKPEPLTNEEQEQMKKHTLFGYEKVKELIDNEGSDGLLVTAKDIVLYHHENFDGTGFPEKLKGLDIPLSARIMRVIDTYEALVNDRCYHKAISHEDAVEFIKNGAGTLFDPDIVDIFVKINRKFI